MWTHSKTPSILSKDHLHSCNRIRFCGIVWIACSLICSAQGTDRVAAVAFEQGVSALAAGHLDQAERDFSLVVRQDPTSSGAHANLGVVAMRRRNWDGALAELRKAVALSPTTFGIRLNIGLVFYRKGDFSAAVPEFAAVLHHDPNSEQARYLLGLCYFFNDSYKASMETLAALWEKQSTNLTYLYVLGSAADKAGDNALELKAFRRMDEVGEDSALFRLYSGKAALGKQDFAAAEQQLRLAVSAEPQLPMAHYFLARALAEQHKSEEARDELLKEIAIEPEVPYSYDELGRVSIELGRKDEAEQAFRKAIERDKAMCTAYLGLAGIYRDAGRYQDEVEMLDHAEALQAESGSIHFMRGTALLKLHETERGHEELRVASRLQRLFHDQLAQPNAGSRAAEAQTTVPE